MQAAVAPSLASEATRSSVDRLVARYQAVRAATEDLCGPLAIEDYVVQSMPDASPAKWHLAHTTWFFEAMLLAQEQPGYRPFHPRFHYLFNSYYVSLGDRHCRAQRGLLSRPTVEEVYRYRRYVDDHMFALMADADKPQWERIAAVVEIGIQHEQQHQELLLTDLKHLFWTNPLWPEYRPQQPAAHGVCRIHWITFPESLVWIGHNGHGFAYDNELPQHRTLLQPFAIASRLATNGEYLAFIDDGGYRRPELWLSDGWLARESPGWQSPLYWEHEPEGWSIMTLAGMRPLDESEPVCHVSYYEADAFARWAGARLPREEEWELAVADCPIEGNFVEGRAYHPLPISPQAAGVESEGLRQMLGDAWEWTASAYLPYPGYRAPAGALGEYNGKFMCNQFVLRGGSCATPQSHIRRTYRNFFAPQARWQFMGIRLARDV